MFCFLIKLRARACIVSIFSHELKRNAKPVTSRKTKQQSKVNTKVIILKLIELFDPSWHLFNYYIALSNLFLYGNINISR
jgi:hypothetical protein